MLLYKSRVECSWPETTEKPEVCRHRLTPGCLELSWASGGQLMGYEITVHFDLQSLKSKWGAWENGLKAIQPKAITSFAHLQTSTWNLLGIITPSKIVETGDSASSHCKTLKPYTTFTARFALRRLQAYSAVCKICTCFQIWRLRFGPGMVS
jgi:hypothetical protein